MTVSRRTMLKGGLAAGAAMAAPAVAREGTACTERWGVHELVFDGPAQGNPFVDVELAATFESSGRSIRVPGFYDGEGVRSEGRRVGKRCGSKGKSRWSP